jgi:hypothetical protein
MAHMIGGIVHDVSGAVIPRAHFTVTKYGFNTFHGSTDLLHREWVS